MSRNGSPTVTPPVLSRNGSATPTARAGSPLPTRERKPGYVALAVLLIVGLAALFGYLYQQAGSKSPVVVVAQGGPGRARAAAR